MVDRPKRAFVTGGAGFIGSHLVHRLLDDGRTITVLRPESQAAGEAICD